MSTNLYGAPAGICAFDDPLANPAVYAQPVATQAPVYATAPYPAPQQAYVQTAAPAPAGDPYVRSYLRGSY
jgi:hypothetical protein